MNNQALKFAMIGEKSLNDSPFASLAPAIYRQKYDSLRLHEILKQLCSPILVEKPNKHADLNIYYFSLLIY